MIHHGDCLSVLRGMVDNSLDACVTDPPYGLSFMGKGWDYDVPSVDIWREVFRVLKPGAHLLAFAGTRTQHRMAVNIEDAGFEIRDMIAWVYGSGFPKSHNLKDEWHGWGTALKPALEPVTVARKPLIGTVAENVQTHGTGALNINGCRVAGWKPQVTQGINSNASSFNVTKERRISGDSNEGRWPANLIHDGSEEVLAGFPQAGGGFGKRGGNKNSTSYGFAEGSMETVGYGDSGSAARFFYCPKASKADRDEGLDHLEKTPGVFFQTGNGTSGKPSSIGSVTAPRANHHPTVKPTDLMRYLCRLVTPPGGVVLDPFMGSGSTGKAATLEGFAFVGIEREADYIEIARARIEHVKAKPRQEALL